MTTRTLLLTLLALIFASTTAWSQDDAGGETPAPDPFPELKARLTSPDFTERTKATEALWALGAKAVQWIESLPQNAEAPEGFPGLR